eukprot:6385811-Amphidinium_carterae.1
MSDAVCVQISVLTVASCKLSSRCMTTVDEGYPFNVWASSIRTHSAGGLQSSVVYVVPSEHNTGHAQSCDTRVVPV